MGKDDYEGFGGSEHTEIKSKPTNVLEEPDMAINDTDVIYDAPEQITNSPRYHLVNPFTGKVYEIFDQVLCIGRNFPGSGFPQGAGKLTVNIASVSRRHAVISTHEGSTFIVDTNSKNGTFVNGKHVEIPMKLSNREIIQIGDLALRIEFP